MKITVNRDLLDEALFFLERTVSKAVTVKASYRAVCFKVVAKHLHLYSLNGYHFCEFYYGEIDAPDCIYYVDCGLLKKIITTTDSEEISLSFTENRLIVADGESEYKLQYLEGIDCSYLFVRKDRLQEPVATISMVDFLNVFPFMAVCIDKPMPLEELRGLYYDGNFVATDATAVAFYPYSDPITTPLFFTLGTFQILSRIASQVSTASFYLLASTVLVICDQVKYIVSLQATPFPNYQLVLDKKNRHVYKAIIDRDVLKAKCKRISVFTDSFNKPATLVFNENSLAIHVQSETKEGKEVLQIQTVGIVQEVSFRINVANLISYLSRLFNDTVQMTFSDNPSEYAILDGVAFYIDGTLK